MEVIRRVGSLSSVLAIGTLLGALGLRLALTIVMPLFILRFMSWDEKRYTRTRKQQQARHIYRKFP